MNRVNWIVSYFLLCQYLLLVYYVIHIIFFSCLFVFLFFLFLYVYAIFGNKNYQIIKKKGDLLVCANFSRAKIEFSTTLGHSSVD